MIRYILFRAKNIRPHLSGGTGRLSNTRGTDLREIREFTHGDDIRDISWNHSLNTAGSIMKKVRNDEETLQIYIYTSITPDSSFFTQRHPTDVYTYSQRITETIRVSAKKYHHRVGDAKVGKTIPENSLIFFIYHRWENLDLQHLKNLSIFNDIICIQLCHPYEESPYNDYIIEGTGVDVIGYKKLWQEQQKKIKKELQHAHCSYLSINTNEDMISKLNIFFKNRYTHNHV